MKKMIRPEIAKEQHGFTPDKGIRNAIFILRMLIEGTIEVKHYNLFQILEKLNIDGKDLRLVRNFYWDQKATMKVNNDTTGYKKINRSVKQDHVQFSDLFNIYSETILGELEDICRRSENCGLQL